MIERRASLAVRPATGADVAFVVAAQTAPHARGFVHSATEDEVRAALARSDRATFVILADDEPVGMLLCGWFPDVAPWLVELRRIVVTRPGQGIGAFAVRWAVEWAFGELGAHRIWLDVVESNQRARRLYERAGFALEGTSRDGFRDADGRFANLCLYGRLATDPPTQ